MSREADIVSYLLGEMPPGEREELEERIGRDPALAHEVERMRAVVAGLEEMPGLGWGGAEPPPLPDLPPISHAARPRRMPALRPALAVAATVAILAAGVGIGLWATGGDEAPAGPTLALDRLGVAGADAAGEARIVSDGGEGLRLSVHGMAPSAAGEFYELWLLDGPDRLVSLGSFRVPASGATEVAVPLPVPVDEFAFIDVSVERDDGDPGHSGVSVLRGPTSSA